VQVYLDNAKTVPLSDQMGNHFKTIMYHNIIITVVSVEQLCFL